MAKNGADILKAANDLIEKQTKSLVRDEIEKQFDKKVVTFKWDQDEIIASQADVLLEGTIVIRFKVWFEQPKDGSPATDPYKHSAALSPRLSEMRGIEFSTSAVDCGSGGFKVRP